MNIADKINRMKAELEENRKNPNNGSPLRVISADGIPTYDIEVYKRELEETPTTEKYDELFIKINNWESSVDIKNGARTQLMEYWNELN